MNIRKLFSYLAWGIVLLVLQVFFFKNLALFGVGLCFLYLILILHMPVNMPPISLILLSFGLGLVVDIFYDTGGIHAAGTTLIGFIRPLWLRAISPTGGYDEGTEPTLQEMGTGWYLTYILPMTFLFSLLFFTVDQWGTMGLFNILNKSFFSSILTALLAILVQALFFKRRRGIL
ncbi:MAG: rod shape-determining protein MreD [Algoriphagus sp.]|uniref:rod shape-determining protein MreD n=1 Tax=Algoriphagus sp. TaxID=1872435 RepID=UPI0017FE53F3|nr:rod shape-determining protein MreD [Algoriphagus sp.]NVJ85501.1 rod shape-determining protein MreD [Algoriphagus sp.]